MSSQSKEIRCFNVFEDDTKEHIYICIKYCTFTSQILFPDNFTRRCLYFEFVYIDFWIISNFVSTSFFSIFINFLLLSFIPTIITFPILSSPFLILFIKLVHSMPPLPPPPPQNSLKISRARNASWSTKNIEIPQETPFPRYPLTFLGCCKNFTTTLLHPPSYIKLSSVGGNTFHRNVGRIGK